MTRTIFIAATLALAVTLPAVPAQALVARTFLSAADSDSNNCANVVTPCRHLATAYAATAPDGEIYVLDPANYGSLTITHGVSIEGHGWASIAPVAGQAAITINAPGATDKINIIGVVLDGTNLAVTTGIQFNSGGSLTVRDSVIRNFQGNGIAFLPSSSTTNQLFVSNTLVSDSGSDGIHIHPTGSGITNGVLNHVEIENNAGAGLTVQTEQPLTSSTPTINITVSDSVSANNTDSGIGLLSTGGTIAGIMVRNSTIANNGTFGLTSGNAGSGIRVTRSTITGNGGAGWSGTVFSYADNNIDLNASANTEPPAPQSYH
jgi:Right handed beta helix region